VNASNHELHESGTPGRNKPGQCTASSLSFLKRTTSLTGRGINISGVDFWHAVEFSKNGRFHQNPFTGPSGRSPSVSSTLPDSSPADSRPGPHPRALKFPSAFRRSRHRRGFPRPNQNRPTGKQFQARRNRPRREIVRIMNATGRGGSLLPENRPGSLTTRRTLRPGEPRVNSSALSVSRGS
jgi:hypothetical protein